MAKAYFCPRCGSKLGEGDLFCIECGHKLEPRKEEETVICPEEEQTPVQFVQEEEEETVLLREDAFFIDYKWNPGGALRLTNVNLTFRAHNGKSKFNVDIPVRDIENLKILRQNKLGQTQQIVVYLKDKHVIFQVDLRSDWFNKINEAANAARSGKSASAPKQKTGYIQELKQLKELVDMGIITEAEFNAKKKNLLGL